MQAFQSRQLRQGGYSAAYIVVFIAILVAANYLADQYNKTYDATDQKLFSLSGQTLGVLDRLESDLTIYYFDRAQNFDGARQSLVRYENASNRVTVEYIDPDSDPARAQEMSIRSYGATVIDIGGRREEAKSTSEEDITNRIIQTLRGEERTACFVLGHGEASPDDTDREGLAVANQEIEAASIGTQTLSLFENPEIPSECSAVVVAGPDNALLEPEIDILRRYVVGGGRLLLLIDHSKSPELAALAAEWGVNVSDDLIFDLSGIGQLFGGGPVVPLATQYEYHSITEPMTAGGQIIPTLFPLARSVAKGDDVESWTVTELFKTSENSFATTDYAGDEIVRNPEAETEGPINLAVAAVYAVPSDSEEDSASGDESEESESDEIKLDAVESSEGRVIVVGTSRFARNTYVGRGGNLDLFLNMLSWLTSDEDLISIRPKDPESTPFDMTAAQMLQLFWGLCVMLPGAIIIAGVRTWWMRR